jgi:Zn-finger nucleic acid-binding protein
MRCPVCETDSLKPLEHEGVELDFCGTCKGMWFDEGEMAFYVETATDMPAFKDVVGTARPGTKTCPHCDREMLEIKYRPEAGLMLDVCSACRGIWLDAGELRWLEDLSTVLHADGKVMRAVGALSARDHVVMGARVTRSK